MMMRILHELNQLEMGGAERVVHGIAKHAPEGVSHVVYAYKDGPMREEFAAIGVEVIIDENEKTPEVDCDVIHIHTGGEASKIASMVKGDMPTIETVHCPVVSAVRDKWVHQRIGVTNEVTRINRNCKTIYNGVDLERLEKTSILQMTLKEVHGIPENAFVIGRLGRIGFDKNVEEFMLACWKFQEKVGQARPVYIVIAGGEAVNAKGYMAKMRVMAASLPLKNVIFIGETKNVGWVYEALDVFLYPSQNEAFGLVWMEAMASGVAVVTWSTPISKELLTGAAYLAPENTIDGLVKGLDLMYRRPEIMEEFQLLGHETACGYFSSEKMSEGYHKAYAELLDRFKSAPIVSDVVKRNEPIGQLG
jgi:glycosyltransferase involved in cell wall biosynthesis